MKPSVKFGKHRGFTHFGKDRPPNTTEVFPKRPGRFLAAEVPPPPPIS